MKNNKNSKRTLTFFGLLSFLSLTASTAMAAIEPSPKKESSVPAIEQQSENREVEKPSEPTVRSNDENWEQVELEKEWSGILGDDSEEEILIGANPV